MTFNCTRSLYRALSLALFTLFVPAAWAFAPHGPEGLKPEAAGVLRGLPFVLAVTDDPAFDAERRAASPSLAHLEAISGGAWHATFDRRTGSLSFAWGAGLPWIPGRGNTLTWKDVTGIERAPASEAEMLDILERRARALMASEPLLVPVPPGVVLVRDEMHSGSAGERVWQLTLSASLQGVAARRSFVTFRLNSGNLVQLGASFLGDALRSAPTQPSMPGDAALVAGLAGLKTALGVEASLTQQVGTPQLELIPWAQDPSAYTGEPGAGLSWRLGWSAAFRVKGGLETWVSVIDATSGEALALFDDNSYACPLPADPRGRVTGGVLLGPIEEVTEEVRGMPNSMVEHGGQLVTDFNGAFDWDPGVPATTTLSGRYFDDECAGCSNPAQAIASASASGWLALGTGGADEVGNGNSTPAERNAYYHLGIVRELASKHLTDAEAGGFIGRVTPAVVNIDATCNAFWDGNGVNFFRAGGGCNNTGTIADVMQHEWGHGLDQFTGGGNDGARGEGLGDTVAFHSTHDPRLGPYFFGGDAAGIRNADETLELYSVATLTTLCDPNPRGGNGPLGQEVHCEGIIYSQAHWHLARNMRTKYGELAGWHMSERLFFRSLPLSDTYVSTDPRSTYNALVLVDDDNGNLADGTPNATEINEALGHHGIAPVATVPDSAGDCTGAIVAPPLTTNVTTNAATGLAEVRVDWPTDPAAVEYQLVRNDAAGLGADLVVARLFAPFGATAFFVDQEVIDGVTYRYRVAGFDNMGCMSQNDNQVTATPGPMAAFSLVSWAIDDSAQNGNGSPDPGETVAIPVQILNATPRAATNVRVTLSTFVPGVTIVPATLNLGDLAGGAYASSTAPHFQVSFPNSVACAAEVPFVVDIESVEGCSGAEFKVLMGTVGSRTLLYSDDFETDTGWRVNVSGLDDATAGAWQRADPNGTFAQTQPGSDHTPGAGTQCFVTGNAVLDPGDPALLGADDVDGGCTTLQSPVIDLAGATGVELTYWRHWAMATMFDDQWLVEISNDGGSNWATLETAEQEIRPFTQARFDLNAIFGGSANRVVLRFSACDRGAGSVIEALVDDVRIEQLVRTCEAPFPRPRLRPLATLLRDPDPVSGTGVGNSNGAPEPGENVRLMVDLVNEGNADATAIIGTLSLTSAPAGVTVSDATATWADLAPAATGRSGSDTPAHFEVALDPAVLCQDGFDVAYSVDYAGPSGTYTVQGTATFVIGIDVDYPLFDDDIEVDLGWTTGTYNGAPNNDFQRGAPTTSSPFDPAAAHSGANVWGNDLGVDAGGMQTNGRYPRNADLWLMSPVIDCSTLSGAMLSFWRQLSVENGDYDHARVKVRASDGVNPEVLTEIWANPPGGDWIDAGWTYVEYDISVLADGLSSVRIEFDLQTDGGYSLGGWNIDDLRIFTRGHICQGNCTTITAPADPGAAVLMATGNKGIDGAEFEWSAAGALGTDEYFTLYRGSTPQLVATAVTPADYTATSYDDRTAPGGPWFYLIRKTNCFGDSSP